MPARGHFSHAKKLGVRKPILVLECHGLEIRHGVNDYDNINNVDAHQHTAHARCMVSVPCRCAFERCRSLENVPLCVGGIFLAFRRHRLGKAGNSEPARSACVCMGVVTDMSHDHLADMSRDTLHRDDPGCWVPNLSLDVRVYGAGLQHQCGGKSE